MVEDAGLVAATEVSLYHPPTYFFYLFCVRGDPDIICRISARFAHTNILLALCARRSGLEHSEPLAPFHDGKIV